MYKPSSAVAGPAPLPTPAGAHLQSWLCWQEAQLPSGLSGCHRLLQRRLLGTDYTFPDGLGNKGCWLSALGLPSAWLEPLQLGSAHPARMDDRDQSVARSRPAAGAPCAGTRRKHGAELPRVSQGQPCSAQDKAQGAATGVNTTLSSPEDVPAPCPGQVNHAAAHRLGHSVCQVGCQLPVPYTASRGSSSLAMSWV